MGLIETPPAGWSGGIRVVRRPRPAGRLRRGTARGSRGNDMAMMFQDPLSALNPVFGRATRSARCSGSTGACPARRPGRRAVELLDRVGIPAAARAGAGVPAPVLGRDAPAGDDRHGPGPRPDAADRRRADDRPRRHRPGPDPRAARRAAGARPAWASCSSPTTSAWWPRSPTGCGHVRRPSRRDGAGRRVLSRAPPPLHRRRCWPRSPARPAAARTACAPIAGATAEPGPRSRPAARSTPAALRDRPLPAERPPLTAWPSRRRCLPAPGRAGRPGPQAATASRPAERREPLLEAAG